MYVSLFVFASSVWIWTPNYENKSQTAVHGYFVIECCSRLLGYSLQTPNIFWFRIRSMQSSTSFKCRVRGEGRSHGASPIDPYRSESVTARNGTEPNSFYQMPEAMQRNLRAAAALASTMEPRNKPPPLPGTPVQFKHCNSSARKISIRAFRRLGLRHERAKQCFKRL